MAPSLLRYYPQDTVFSNTVLQAAGNEIFLLRGEAWRVHYVKPQGYSAAHLVNVTNYLTGDTGDMDYWVVVREAQEDR
jgi:hypothetical protein